MIVLVENIREAPPVAEQPVVRIQHWRLIEERGLIHLAGWINGAITIRLTSPVRDVNLAARQVTTDSGRLYELAGPPTDDADRLVLIAARLASVGAVWQGIDVSDRIWADMLKGAH